ncbi:hypothetical protein ABIA31_005494 [Catenulispora sp. MAP5-51]|uniref:hypothetical protein n=1 Tax=Catenulispora sp. MAP5-51 TaxID=3156298 RepID=UPI003515EEA1
MSAQDDVLAAFGEPPSWPRTQDEAAGDEASGDEATGDGEVAVEEQTDNGHAEADTSEQPAEDNGAGEVTANEQPAEDNDPGEVAEATANEKSAEDDGAGKVAEATASKQPAEASDADAPAEPPAGAPESIAPAPIPTATTQTPALAEAPTPTQPYLDPAAFFAQLQAEAAPKPKPRWPRLVLRYGSALVVAGAVGAGTAYAVTIPRRTDVPFLATASDGRYSFLNVTHPVPPAGEPAPGADSNQTQTHYGDLRQYLVPAPVGVVPKESGWEAVADFENSLSGSDVSGHLYDAGISRVAWRGWTAPDGQHTVVELVQFPDHEAAFSVAKLLDNAALAKASRPESVVPELTVPGFGDDTSAAVIRRFDQVVGLPGQVERRVVFQSGDVVAIVTSTAPAKVSDTPTVQVALLEAGMLR